MARETIEFRIGDCTYKCTHLKAREQRIVLRRILSVASALSDFQGSMDNVAALVGDVVSSLSDDDLDTVTKCFADVSEVRTPQSGGVFVPLSSCADDHFAGANMSAWLQWVKQNIDHNYSGFFAELRGMVDNALRAVQESELESPSISTG